MAEEMIQLWRGEPIPPEGERSTLADWITESTGYRNAMAACGRWFTHDRQAALWYIDNEHGGKGFLRTLTLHRDVALVYRVDQFEGRDKNIPDSPRAFSRDPQSEYFLPIEVARRAQPEVARPEIPRLGAVKTILKPDLLLGGKEIR
jgi:hypothetical protein